MIHPVCCRKQTVSRFGQFFCTSGCDSSKVISLVTVIFSSVRPSTLAISFKSCTCWLLCVTRSSLASCSRHVSFPVPEHLPESGCLSFFSIRNQCLVNLSSSSSTVTSSSTKLATSKTSLVCLLHQALYFSSNLLAKSPGSTEYVPASIIDLSWLTLSSLISEASDTALLRPDNHVRPVKWTPDLSDLLHSAPSVSLNSLYTV